MTHYHSETSLVDDDGLSEGGAPTTILVRASRDAATERRMAALRGRGVHFIELGGNDAIQPALAELARAGVALWVLTGDKLETAVNIGYACSLIREDMLQFCVRGSSDAVDALEAAHQAEAALEAAVTEKRTEVPAMAIWVEGCVVITGATAGTNTVTAAAVLVTLANRPRPSSAFVMNFMIPYSLANRTHLMDPKLVTIRDSRLA